MEDGPTAGATVRECDEIIRSMSLAGATLMALKANGRVTFPNQGVHIRESLQGNNSIEAKTYNSSQSTVPTCEYVRTPPRPAKSPEHKAHKGVATLHPQIASFPMPECASVLRCMSLWGRSKL